MIHELALAWAAGFFDGEGSIVIVEDGSRSHSIWLQPALMNTDLPALSVFHEAVGGLGSIQGPRKTPASMGYGIKPMYGWQASSLMAVKALSSLRPYLVSKAAEADVGLDAQNKWGFRPAGSAAQPMSDELREIRRASMFALRKLKGTTSSNRKHLIEQEDQQWQTVAS